MRARNSRHADTSNLVYWASAQSGQWSDAQNWSTGKAPETADTAVISARRPAGKYDVAITHPASAGILRINAPSASVDDESTLKIGSVLELDAGTFYLDLGGNLTGGRIVVGAGAKFAPIGGTLSHIKFEGTMSGNGNLTIGAGVSFSAARGNGPAMIDSIGGTIAVVGTSRLNNVDISLPGTLISRASSTETGLLVLGGNVTVTQAPNSFFEGNYPVDVARL